MFTLDPQQQPPLSLWCLYYGCVLFASNPLIELGHVPVYNVAYDDDDHKYLRSVRRSRRTAHAAHCNWRQCMHRVLLCSAGWSSDDLQRQLSWSMTTMNRVLSLNLIASSSSVNNAMAYQSHNTKAATPVAIWQKEKQKYNVLVFYIDIASKRSNDQLIC